MCCDAVAAHHGIDAGLSATETLVQRHRGLSATAGENVIDPLAGSLTIEDAILLEAVKGVTLDHLPAA